MKVAVIFFLLLIALYAIYGSPFSDIHNTYFESCIPPAKFINGKCAGDSHEYMISWRVDKADNSVTIEEDSENGLTYLFRNCAIMDSHNWNCGERESKDITPVHAGGLYYCNNNVCQFGQYDPAHDRQITRMEYQAYLLKTSWR